MTPRIEILDLHFQGAPGLIASFLLQGPDGYVLIETGPGSCHETLVAALAGRGLAPTDIDAVLVTHIHFDHAGGAGWWAQQGVRLCVHEVGARHVIDPSRLIGSATRIYGDRMETLWGEILPAPEEHVRALADGDVVDAGGISIRAIHTPGHAGHHHVYRVGDVGFVGDAMGIRGGATSWLDLPAPPPEFDLEVWKRTVQRLREEGFDSIYRTHFGPTDDVPAELDRVEELIEASAQTVRALLEEGVERDEMIERYRSWMAGRAVAEGADPALLVKDGKLNPRAMSVDGIARYWKKRAEAGSSDS